MSTTRGIVSYGAYVPYWRLERSAIAGALGGNPARGTRSVASYDEDTTSMGVEAARIALQHTMPEPTSLFFATAEPAYQDKTNATGITAALGLGPDVLSADVVGAVRSGAAAIHAGLRGDEPTLVVLSDVRTGLPGSVDERDGGDGAAALVLGSAAESPLVAEYLGGASVSGEFLDRWRIPGDGRSQVWEERFGESQYVPLAERALRRALEAAALTASDLDTVVVTGLHTRAVKAFVKRSGLGRDQIAADLTSTIGNTGTAHAGIVLSSVLDAAPAGHVVAVILLADGADVLLFRTTEHLTATRSARPVAAQIAGGRSDLDYSTFLSWRGRLEQEPPRRPNPDRPAGPPSVQRAEWKFAFAGTRCECGQAHLPPQRVCVACGLVDRMNAERLSDTPATVATYTVDHLAYSMSPPVVAAIIDFDGGGRFASELTDVDPDELAVGTRVEMTFRRLYTSGGVHNYFWKARPVAKEIPA